MVGRALAMGSRGSYIAGGVIRFPVYRHSMPESAPPQDAASVIAQEFIVDEPCSLAVDIPGAHTYLRPGSASERMEVEISVTGCPADEAEDILDRMQVGTQQMKDTVRVYSDVDKSNAEWWRWLRTLDVEVHVQLLLPSRVEADLRVPGGHLDIANLEGHIDIKVMGGSLKADNLEGILDVRAESSDVSITNFSGDQVVARVAVGTLTLENVDANVLTLRSVSAPVQLTDITGATDVTANSTDVEIEALSGPCTVRSQGGPVVYESTPTDETELTVVGSTLDAYIPSSHEADLIMTGATLSLDGAFTFEGDRTEHRIEGTLNGGGPQLDLRAIGGTANCHAA